MLKLQNRTKAGLIGLGCFICLTAVTSFAATIYGSSDACFNAIAAQNLNTDTYGTRLNDPCDLSSGRGFVYSTKTSPWYGCSNSPTFNSADNWTIQLFNKSTTHYAIWSSSGPDSSGAIRCVSVPYVSSFSTDYSSFGAPKGAGTLADVKISNETLTNTPIEVNIDPVLVARYGIPKSWAKTRTIDTMTAFNNNNNTNTQVTISVGRAGQVDWNH